MGTLADLYFPKRHKAEPLSFLATWLFLALENVVMPLIPVTAQSYGIPPENAR
jgi:hypothetical protein